MLKRVARIFFIYLLCFTNNGNHMGFEKERGEDNSRIFIFE